MKHRSPGGAGFSPEEALDPGAGPSSPHPEDREDGDALSPSLWFFLSAVILSQIGLEAVRLAMPQLVKAALGRFTYLAELHFISGMAGIAGRLIGGALPDRFGLKTVYLAAKGFKIVLVLSLAAFVASGHTTLAVLAVYYLFNGFSVGITRTTVLSIPPAVAAQSRSALERYWATQRVGLTAVQIAGPFLAASLLAAYGFLPAFLLMPVTFAAAVLLIVFGTKVPRPEESVEAGRSTGWRDFLLRSVSGGRIIFEEPTLRAAFFSFTGFLVLTPTLYMVIAPAYGLWAAGGELAAGALIHARITGLFSAGGLLGALIMLARNRRLSAARRAGGLSTDEHRKAMDRSTLGWMHAAALSLFAFLPLLHPALRGTAPVYAAVFLFGIPQAVTLLKLRSLFQARVPDPRDVPRVMGFLTSAAVVMLSATLYGLGWVFDHLDGPAALGCVSAYMAASAAVHLLLLGRLRGRLRG